MIHPLVILAIGLATVIVLILLLRANAFLALLAAAILVSLLAPGELDQKIPRVAAAFGTVAGKIGIIIALAAVIGHCLMHSGAADRIVRSLLAAWGEKRAPEALAAAGFVLSIPVFFDTVFYLMVPLARSLARQTRRDYLLYILAIGAGGVVTHALVPPTPGPLLIASILHIDLGMMIIVGIIVGIPTAIAGLAASRALNGVLQIPLRPLGGEAERAPAGDDELPGLAISLAPILLPAFLIALQTITRAVAGLDGFDLGAVTSVMSVLGDANFALFLSALLALGLLAHRRRLSLVQLAKATEEALLSAGVIILITAAGGAFGKMIEEAQVGRAIQEMFGAGGRNSGMAVLLLGFGVAAVLKTSQGSTTVAMITASGMLSGLTAAPETLGCHPVYLAAAIAYGALFFSWMNDSGFWIVARMSGLAEAEALKSWTVMTAVVAVSGMAFTLLAAWLVPLV